MVRLGDPAPGNEGRTNFGNDFIIGSKRGKRWARRYRRPQEPDNDVQHAYAEIMRALATVWPAIDGVTQGSWNAIVPAPYNNTAEAYIAENMNDAKAEPWRPRQDYTFNDLPFTSIPPTNYQWTSNGNYGQFTIDHTEDPLGLLPPVWLIPIIAHDSQGLPIPEQGQFNAFAIETVAWRINSAQFRGLITRPLKPYNYFGMPISSEGSFGVPEQFTNWPQP